MRLALLALLLVVLTSPLSSQTRHPRPRAASAQPSEEEDRKAIEDLHQRDINANVAFDLDQLVALCDDSIVAMPPDSPPLAGVAAYRKYLDQQRDKLANVDILSYDEQWDEVRVLGDYAYEYGSIRSRRQPEETKKEAVITLNVMRILKREPSGDWKIYRAIWNDRAPTASAPASPPRPGF